MKAAVSWWPVLCYTCGCVLILVVVPMRAARCRRIAAWQPLHADLLQQDVKDIHGHVHGCRDVGQVVIGHLGKKLGVAQRVALDASDEGTIGILARGRHMLLELRGTASLQLNFTFD